jgi:hypothetical protein
MNDALIPRVSIAVLACALVASGSSHSRDATPEQAFSGFEPVAGTGVHYFSTAIIHAQEPTATGMVQHSTDIVELQGDLVGRVLVQAVSVFDFAAGTLVNTGHQVYSGTMLGLGPVMLYDDAFRFEVDLATGATVGQVHLTGHLAGPKIHCHLDVVGTGLTSEGDSTVAYTGGCRIWPGRRAR